MADVTVHADVESTAYRFGKSPGPFFTTKDIGYMILGKANVFWVKTSDGGGTWTSAAEIDATTWKWDSWADWGTPGDSGSLIHIALQQTTGDDSFVYHTLDTSDDSLTGPALIENIQGSGILDTGKSWEANELSICKAKGGNVYVAMGYKDDASTDHVRFSRDTGSGFANRASPIEEREDHFQLFPANLTDENDIWCLYWDATANEVTIKTYDDSANSWSESNALAMIGNSTDFQQMAGMIRHSDGHLIFAMWNDIDTATADLQVFDFNGEATIPELAGSPIITNEAENAQCAVFVVNTTSGVDQDDIYVSYLQGTWLATVDASYQKSDNDGTTFGSEIDSSVDTPDDHRAVWHGPSKNDAGGRFMPAWMDDDDNDVFVNKDTSVVIEAIVAGGLSIPIAMHHYKQMMGVN